MYIVVGILCLFFIFFFVYLICKRHIDFIEAAKNIKQGMTYDEVISIMKIPPTSTEHDDDKKILIWEKNQWKGIQHGGTLTRAVKITFKNNIVISIATKNLDKSTFF